MLYDGICTLNAGILNWFIKQIYSICLKFQGQIYNNTLSLRSLLRKEQKFY